MNSVKLNENELEKLMTEISDIVFRMNDFFQQEVMKVVSSKRWKDKMSGGTTSYIPIFAAAQFAAVRAFNNELVFKELLKDKIDPLMLADEQLREIMKGAKLRINALREASIKQAVKA